VCNSPLAFRPPRRTCVSRIWFTAFFLAFSSAMVAFFCCASSFSSCFTRSRSDGSCPVHSGQPPPPAAAGAGEGAGAGAGGAGAGPLGLAAGG
jgi:hypothetical protein